MGDNRHRETVFRFRRFSVRNELAAMKVGTDGVLLGAWTDGAGAVTALDAGCGCGLIALMLCQRYPQLKVTAVDIMPEAVEESRANVAASPWPDRVEVCRADFGQIGSSSLTGAPFDLVVSNPPFFQGSLEAMGSGRQTARQGTWSLSAESLIRRCATVDGLLRDGGRLSMVVPYAMRECVLVEAALSAMSVVRMTSVSTRVGSPPKRLLVELVKGRSSNPAESDCLLVGSDEYRSLTGDFYL